MPEFHLRDDRVSWLHAMKELHGIHVLVVDDDDHVRDALAGTLEWLGATVLQAGSAADARGALTRQLPDVMLCDISMPFEDGCTFIARLRASGGAAAALPATAITANTSVENRERALASGFGAVLLKPFSVEDLAAAVLDSLPPVELRQGRAS
jgi:CheY-like chemotaxis protein